MKDKILYFFVIAFTIILLFMSIQGKEIKNINKVVMDEEIKAQLNFDFTKDNENFAYCLKSHVVEDTLIIDELLTPKDIGKTEENHLSLSCSKGTIVTIHSHKNRFCRLSLFDAFALGSLKQTAIGVICDENVFAFYTPNSIDNSIKIDFIS